MAVTFCYSGQDSTVSNDEARWLLGQLRTARELTPDGAAVAAKIEQALNEETAVNTNLSENRALIEALERGSGKPRSHQLRQLEIGLHAAVYSEA